MLRDVHDGDTRNLAQSPLQVAIAGGHDVAAMLGDSVDQAVVSVRPLVGAGEPLEARVLGDALGHSELRPQLLQLSHDAVGDAWSTWR